MPQPQPTLQQPRQQQQQQLPPHLQKPTMTEMWHLFWRLLEQWDKTTSKAAYQAISNEQRDFFKLMEWSGNMCNWVYLTIALSWFGYGSLELWLNFSIMMTVDLAITFVLRGVVRRLRPAFNPDLQYQFELEKWLSFPSARASRATAIIVFFNKLYPLSSFVGRRLFLAWGVTVMASRVLLGTNYILDVFGSVLLGLMQYPIMNRLWVSEHNAEKWATMISPRIAALFAKNNYPY